MEFVVQVSVVPSAQASPQSLQVWIEVVPEGLQWRLGLNALVSAYRPCPSGPPQEQYRVVALFHEAFHRGHYMGVTGHVLSRLLAGLGICGPPCLERVVVDCWFRVTAAYGVNDNTTIVMRATSG